MTAVNKKTAEEAKTKLTAAGATVELKQFHSIFAIFPLTMYCGGDFCWPNELKSFFPLNPTYFIVWLFSTIRTRLTEQLLRGLVSNSKIAKIAT